MIGYDLLSLSLTDSINQSVCKVGEEEETMIPGEGREAGPTRRERRRNPLTFTHPTE